MLYHEFLKINTDCPFCEPRNIKGVIDRNDEAFMTYAISPYHRHHVLVIPDRHIETFEDLNEQEVVAIDKLLRIGVKMIKSLGYENYTILVRNGNENNKSIEHLHYHIVPNVPMISPDYDSSIRKIMSEEEIIQILEDFENIKMKDIF